MTPRIKVKPKKRVVKAWCCVDVKGRIKRVPAPDPWYSFDGVYLKKYSAEGHERIGQIIPCEIVYQLPKRKAK